jgi:hypothetical protein
LYSLFQVRKVCQDSLNTLQRVSSEAQVLSDKVFTLEDLVNSINKAIVNNGVSEVRFLLTHTA